MSFFTSSGWLLGTPRTMYHVPVPVSVPVPAPAPVPAPLSSRRQCTTTASIHRARAWLAVSWAGHCQAATTFAGCPPPYALAPIPASCPPDPVQRSGHRTSVCVWGGGGEVWVTRVPSIVRPGTARWTGSRLSLFHSLSLTPRNPLHTLLLSMIEFASAVALSL